MDSDNCCRSVTCTLLLSVICDSNSTWDKALKYTLLRGRGVVVIVGEDWNEMVACWRRFLFQVISQTAAIAVTLCRFQSFSQLSILATIYHFSYWYGVWLRGRCNGASSRDVVECNTSATRRVVVRETVPHWNVANYWRLYPNTLDARRFGAMLSVERNCITFDCLAVRGDRDIGAWN